MELKFLGAAGSVTGSCYILKTSRHTLLLECGQFQGGPEDEERNRLPFPIPVDDVHLAPRSRYVLRIISTISI